jgi:hypothetical protein
MSIWIIWIILSRYSIKHQNDLARNTYQSINEIGWYCCHCKITAANNILLAVDNTFLLLFTKTIRFRCRCCYALCYKIPSRGIRMLLLEHWSLNQLS